MLHHRRSLTQWLLWNPVLKKENKHKCSGNLLVYCVHLFTHGGMHPLFLKIVFSLKQKLERRSKTKPTAVVYLDMYTGPLRLVCIDSWNQYHQENDTHCTTCMHGNEAFHWAQLYPPRIASKHKEPRVSMLLEYNLQMQHFLEHKVAPPRSMSALLQGQVRSTCKLNTYTRYR